MFCYICKARDRTVSYHVFPKEATLRRRWLKFFSLEEDDILKFTCVCSNHFHPECFVNKSGRRRLKTGSFPTFLAKEQQNKRKEMRDVSDVEGESKSPKRPLCTHTQDATGFSKPERAKGNFMLAKDQIKTLKGKIVNIITKRRRLNKKVKTFKEYLSHMRKRQMLTEDAECSITVWVNQVTRLSSK